MKNTKQTLKLVLIAIIAITTQIGCGKKSDGPSVNVQFTNHSASEQRAEYEAVGIRGLMRGLSMQTSSLLGITPRIYQKKLVAFYMVEAMEADGTNKGAGTHIWTNKNCDSDLTYCGINPDHANGYLADYFDFAKGSAAVNADFNSYKRDTKDSQLGTGTYNYIRMDFTGKVFSDSDNTPNLKFGDGEAHEVRSQDHALLVKLPEPLVIEKNDTITVDLAYSLDNIFYAVGDRESNLRPSEVSDEAKWTCANSESASDCIVEVEFSPTVTKK